MSRVVRAVGSVFDLSDVVGVVGFVSLLYGIAAWSRPAAFVTAGVLLIAVAVAPTMRKRKG